jgi:hypothetical protein
MSRLSFVKDSDDTYRAQLPGAANFLEVVVFAHDALPGTYGAYLTIRRNTVTAMYDVLWHSEYSHLTAPKRYHGLVHACERAPRDAFVYFQQVVRDAAVLDNKPLPPGDVRDVRSPASGELRRRTMNFLRDAAKRLTELADSLEART